MKIVSLTKKDLLILKFFIDMEYNNIQLDLEKDIPDGYREYLEDLLEQGDYILKKLKLNKKNNDL